MCFENVILDDHFKMFEINFFETFDQKDNHYKIYVLLKSIYTIKNYNTKRISTLTLSRSQNGNLPKNKNMLVWGFEPWTRSKYERYYTTRLKTEFVNYAQHIDNQQPEDTGKHIDNQQPEDTGICQSRQFRKI